MAGLIDMRNDEIMRRRLLAPVRSRIRPADTARVYGRGMGLSTKHAALSWVGRFHLDVLRYCCAPFMPIVSPYYGLGSEARITGQFA